MADLLSKDRIYTIEDVCRLLLAHSPSWWSRHQERLYAMGFPRPIAPVGHPRWSGADLIAWRDRPKLDGAVEAAPNVHNLRTVLAERGAALAQRTEKRA